MQIQEELGRCPLKTFGFQFQPGDELFVRVWLLLRLCWRWKEQRVGGFSAAGNVGRFRLGCLQRGGAIMGTNWFSEMVWSPHLLYIYI